MGRSLHLISPEIGRRRTNHERRIPLNLAGRSFEDAVGRLLLEVEMMMPSLRVLTANSIYKYLVFCGHCDALKYSAEMPGPHYASDVLLDPQSYAYQRSYILIFLVDMDDIQLSALERHPPFQVVPARVYHAG